MIFREPGTGHREVRQDFAELANPPQPASALGKSRSPSELAAWGRAVELYRCEECDRELFDFGDGPPPTRCDDCIPETPETGPGSRLVDQLASNLRRLRAKAGVEREELARRAAMSAAALSLSEGDDPPEPSVTKALRFAHSLGVSIDELADRVYWNPGERARRPGDRRAPSERLSGFFLVLPANVPVFEPAPSRDPVTSRLEAAAIFGQNVRSARERRHMTQRALAGAAGLSKAGLSLIERGIRETTIETLLSLARALEVTPGFLLGGIVWKPRQPDACTSAAGRGGAQRRDAHSLDHPIKRLWGEGKTAGEIADALGTSRGSISAIVHRLREHGEVLAYREPARRAVHEGARRRRGQRRPMCAPNLGHFADKTKSVEEPAGEEVSETDVSARIAANVAFHRHKAERTLRELGEAAELHITQLSRMERRKAGVPQLSLVLRLAASLNVRCDRLAAGIRWDPTAAMFKLEDESEDTALQRLGRNTRWARREINLSQQALSARAAMGRGDVVDFEQGSRNFRIFAAVRLAGALGLDLANLFSGVGDWHVRPLPAPEYGPGDHPPSKAERDALLVRLWREGRPERDIADALDLKVDAVGSCVRELRDAGERLPHRRPPRRPVESAARRRRQFESR